MKLFFLGLVVVAGCTSSSNGPFCGDGFLDSGEQCDDGNGLNGDGCSATCVVEVTAPACGDLHVDSGEECDDGNKQSGDGCSATCQIEGARVIHASWTLKTIAGATETCPPGFDTASVTSQHVDPTTLTPIGPPVIDLFDCDAGLGTTTQLAAADYFAFISIENTSGSSVFETTPVTEVDLRLGDKNFAATLYSDGGYFAFAWHLTKASNGDPLTCAQAQADGVESVSTQVSGPANSVDDIFDCADGLGITSVMVPGTYTVSIDAINATNQAIGNSPALTNKVIMDANRVTDLGSVAIPIDTL